MATLAIACAGFGRPMAPAAANASGTTIETPRPISPKPAIAAAEPGEQDEQRTEGGQPQGVPRSPCPAGGRPGRRRAAPPAMAKAKAVNAVAAAPGFAPVTFLTETADQSPAPPSANTAQKPRSPMRRTAADGSANTGPWSPGSRPSRSRPEADQAPAAEDQRGTTVKWMRASIPLAAASAPIPEATSPPALHRPCSQT